MDKARVQAIAELATRTNTIPEEFIQSTPNQPATTTLQGPPLEIPIVDLGDPDEASLVGHVARAGREWGLFHVVNHGVPCHVVSEFRRVGREFFELPPEEKEKYSKEDGKGIEGYGTVLQKEVEGKKGWVDHLFHVVWPPNCVNYKFWPLTPASYREANEEYVKHLRVVAAKLLECLSLGLGLDANELMVAAAEDGEMEYLLKINYYPPCPRPDLVLGVVAHTDMSLMTILVPNEVQGLQVFRDGVWYDVKYVPNALIIHIGDQIEIMSNGEYKAVLHRSIVNKERPRMSWAVFLNPPPERVIGPSPKLTAQPTKPKYKPKKYSDYVYCKLNKIPQ